MAVYQTILGNTIGDGLHRPGEERNVPSPFPVQLNTFAGFRDINLDQACHVVFPHADSAQVVSGEA
jgi:hypothetical protein